MSKKSPKANPAYARMALFEEQAIRRSWHQSRWWFSVTDVIAVLSGSATPRRYWSDLKRKLAAEAGSEQTYEKIVQLILIAADGKQRATDCADTETLLRIVQSIPSQRAEPFKRWLAQVGYELNIPRYVDTLVEEEEIDGAAVREERKKLKAELARFEEPMAKYLAELGYE